MVNHQITFLERAGVYSYQSVFEYTTPHPTHKRTKKKTKKKEEEGNS